jgi:hypothetical protein
MTTSTRRSAQAVEAGGAFAFYGRTNQRDSHEPTMSARQYRQCTDALAGCGVVSHFYDDTLHEHRFHLKFLAEEGSS